MQGAGFDASPVRSPARQPLTPRILFPLVGAGPPSGRDLQGAEGLTAMLGRGAHGAALTSIGGESTSGGDGSPHHQQQKQRQATQQQEEEDVASPLIKAARAPDSAAYASSSLLADAQRPARDDGAAGPSAAAKHGSSESHSGGWRHKASTACLMQCMHLTTCRDACCSPHACDSRGFRPAPNPSHYHYLCRQLRSKRAPRAAAARAVWRHCQAGHMCSSMARSWAPAALSTPACGRTGSWCMTGVPGPWQRAHSRCGGLPFACRKAWHAVLEAASAPVLL